MTTGSGQHWSDYWRQGHLTSLPRGFAGNYDGEFLAFWLARFADLPRSARVLDVCAGNGAIALLASEYSQQEGLNFRVTATDAADIDLQAITRPHPHLEPVTAGIDLLPNMPLEKLALPPESIDLACSQFGIEYTAWQRSASILSRALKPGASLALDAIYVLFQQNRSSQLLAAVGQRLEDIRKLTLQQFEAGWREFTRFRQGILTSRGIAADLLAVNHALRDTPRWYEAFSDQGLALLDSGDIHYHTGDIAGRSYRFRKPARDSVL